MSDVVRLITRREREAQEDASYKDEVHAEAIAILERAISMGRDRRLAGIAVSLVFDDGCYGRILPELSSNLPGLIASIATTQHDLLLRTLTDQE